MSCDRSARLSELVLAALPAAEARALTDHATDCPECRAELEALRVVADSLAAWPDLLQPSASLGERLARRIASETGGQPASSPEPWSEPAWVEVAPGITCQFLATDAERQLVSMLVRLAPNTSYPPHMHAAVEELHLLDGELWIDDRKLYPGDYNRADPGTSDARVWSETGCLCVLITSARDELTSR